MSFLLYHLNAGPFNASSFETISSRPKHYDGHQGTLFQVLLQSNMPKVRYFKIPLKTSLTLEQFKTSEKRSDVLNKVVGKMVDLHKPNEYFYINLLPRIQSLIMASESKDSAFNILGSSKLNTTDGKNPTSSAIASTSTQPATASVQKNSEEYRRVRNPRVIISHWPLRPESQEHQASLAPETDSITQALSLD